VLTYEVVALGEDEVVVALRGSLADDNWTQRLRDFLDEHYVNDGVQTIRVDLAEVVRMDLEGVATLVVLSKEAARRGKRFVVAGVRGQPAEKLEQTGTLRYLEGG
jgi:anti-anti-sigma factor